ncbi:MAG: hypothetical protein WKF70_13125 [Chitinophagaceae bacterium]
MTLKEIHEFILFVLDKEINGYSTPKEIDQALDRASKATFKQMLPYYAENQSFQDALAPFKVPHIFTHATSPAGVVVLPVNYVHFLALTVSYYDNIFQENKYQNVEVVNSDELAERLSSQLKPVTQLKPVIHWIGKRKFQLYPKGVNVGECWYLKSPDAPQYVFTQVGRVTTYDSVNSVQLEWDELELNNVMFRALQLLGVNLSNDQMIQYTQLKIQDA